MSQERATVCVWLESGLVTRPLAVSLGSLLPPFSRGCPLEPFSLSLTYSLSLSHPHPHPHPLSLSLSCGQGVARHLLLAIKGWRRQTRPDAHTHTVSLSWLTTSWKVLGRKGAGFLPVFVHAHSLSLSQLTTVPLFQGVARQLLLAIKIWRRQSRPYSGHTHTQSLSLGRLLTTNMAHARQSRPDSCHTNTSSLSLSLNLSLSLSWLTTFPLFRGWRGSCSWRSRSGAPTRSGTHGSCWRGKARTLTYPTLPFPTLPCPALP